jgi:5-formyltetrahydrofolate cyclo-ligase
MVRTDVQLHPRMLSRHYYRLTLVLPKVLVPGLAFDGSGGRLGRGAGLYDEWLQVNLRQFETSASATCDVEQISSGSCWSKSRDSSGRTA